MNNREVCVEGDKDCQHNMRYLGGHNEFWYCTKCDRLER